MMEELLDAPFINNKGVGSGVIQLSNWLQNSLID
jgi:hypothetical protein